MRSRKARHKPAPAKSVRKNNVRLSPSAHPALLPASHAKGDSPENRLPEQEVDFAQLKDGSLVEIVEDAADPSRTLLAVFSRGRVRFTDRLEDCGRILVPIPRTTEDFSEVKLPRGIMRYRSVMRLFHAIASCIEYVADVPPEYLFVLAAFVLYTWVADCLPIAVYVSITGLSQSGKSTLLEVLSLICRQPLFVTDISQASLYRVCTCFSPTLLFDEIDWHSSKTTNTLRQMLRAGTIRSSRALRIRGSSWSFGPKILSSLESSSDSALNSRCIHIPMTETDKRGLVKPGDPRLVKLAGNVQQQLLKFRFDNYGSIRPAVVLGAEELRPRSRDLLASLAAPLAGSRLWPRFLLGFFKFRHDPLTRQFLPPRQDALLAVVWEVIHRDPSPASVRVKDLAEGTNALLPRVGERPTVTDKGAGTMLTDLGFRSKVRTKRGWVLLLDSATVHRAHQLVKIHGNSYLQPADFERFSKICPTCRG